MVTIHPTAIVHSGAQLGENVVVGPYCIVNEHVKIGDASVLKSHVVVDGHTTLGRECEVFPYACVGFKTQDLKFAGGATFAVIGDKTVLREFSTIHTGTKDGEVTRIGSGCLIMAYCHVAHGCELGNEIIMSNASQLAGEVKVGDRAIIGAMTGVHQFCRIGTMAMIGAISKIRQDCPPYMMTEGNEATAVIGPNVVGLQRRGFSQEVRTALKEAYRILYREGMNRSQAMERIRYEVADLPEIRHLIEFYAQSTRGVV